MLSKRPRPMIGKLSELLLSGGSSRSAAAELATSPRSPLDLKMVQSPRALIKYDAGGVGLGIVAALEKSSKAKYAICSQSLCRSNPIPARSNCSNKCARFEETESLEDYTIVTTHGPNRSFTKVYYAGVEYENSNYDHFIDSKQKSYDQSDLYPTSSFLSSCNLCRKDLHGKDIYMYRGEKAFCSTECRSKQIMMDERKEHCRSDASRSVDVSSSPYSRGQIFSTGIAAV